MLRETRSGTTTFTSKATGRRNLEIGHGLRSCDTAGTLLLPLAINVWVESKTGTQHIQIPSIMLGGKVVFLIDTLGFNDTIKGDVEILEFLTVYEAGKLLHAIILLQLITTTRFAESEAKQMSRQLLVDGRNAQASQRTRRQAATKTLGPVGLAIAKIEVGVHCVTMWMS